MRKISVLAASLALIAPAFAENRQLDTIKFTGVSTFPGFEDVEAVGIFWDERCARVDYTLNDIPATGAGGAPIPAAALRAEVQRGLDRWNENRSSFIELNVARIASLGARPRRGGDFINEVTFFTAPGFAALASSPSTALNEDATFTDGDDLDGDGDSDVFSPANAAQNRCQDIDGDGDHEFPAGDYKAGTILDNDVQFSRTVVWELTPTDGPETDIDSVSTHEFGHSHGLNHSSINQISASNPSGSTMFPFIDTDDGAAEAATRTLHTDDLANSAKIYPEGSSSKGIAALQRGDIPFHLAYALIKGSTLRGDIPYVGANIQAVRLGTNEILAETYAGKGKFFLQLSSGGLFVSDPDSAVDGDYEIPAPRGALYQLAFQSLDGDPAATGNISLTAQVGSILDSLRALPPAPEEYRGPNALEDDIERNPEIALPVFAGATGQDFVVNRESTVRNANAFTNSGLGGLVGATGIVYAQRFANADVLAQLNAGAFPVSGLFRTGNFDASFAPKFKSAKLALGRANADGTATIETVLREEGGFVGQERDSTPFYFALPSFLAYRLQHNLSADPTLDVFLVLEALDGAPVGPSGLPTALLGLSTISPSGNAYFAINGSPLTQRTTFDWLTEIRFAPAN